jgi:DNA-directed RNA polymerase specialized sigma24 family protein
MGVTEPESFVAKVLAVALDLYPDGVLPELPSWFPVDTLEDLPPASALLTWITAVDLAERSVPLPLWRANWALTFLWIGLETGDEERIDFSLDTLLGTSGRGWLANRMTEMGLDRADLHHELRFLCVEMIYDFAERRARVDDGAKAYGYVRNTFRNRLEDRLNELVAERGAQRPETPLYGDDASPVVDRPTPENATGLSLDERTMLSLLVERAGLSGRESEAIQLMLQGLEGEGLAKALGVKAGTAGTLIHRAKQKIRKGL